MPDQLKAEITLDVRSSSFWCRLWSKNAFNCRRWCHSNRFLMLRNHTGMVVPRANAFTCHRWCHSNRFLMLRNHTGMVVPRAFHSYWNLFYIRRLFGSFSFSFLFLMRYCTKALQTNVIYNSAERCYLLVNGALKTGFEQKESSWSKFV